MPNFKDKLVKEFLSDYLDFTFYRIIFVLGLIKFLKNILF